MNLETYLRRIGYEGTPRPDLDTLVALHRRHLAAIPYENLDIQFGRRCDLDVGRSYRKLVVERRGGWCYEMNGLFGWALGEIGFEVTRVNGAVLRAERGDAAVGNHVVLLVELDRTWLADVGFGDGLVEPVPLEAGEFVQHGFPFRLERMDDDFWRFHNHAEGGAASFDFRASPADEALFESCCDHLQSSPESPFVMNLVCQRFVDGAYEVQRGRVAKRISAAGVNSWLLDDAGELVRRLRDTFDLDVPEAAGLWPRILDRHAAFFAGRDAIPAATPRFPGDTLTKTGRKDK